MEAQSGYCRGCRRTLDEIARWGEMTDAEREAVLAALRARASDIAERPVPPLA
jgi:predicted Fe-S protein YdhL (DUF1289 family)